MFWTPAMRIWSMTCHQTGTGFAVGLDRHGALRVLRPQPLDVGAHRTHFDDALVGPDLAVLADRDHDVPLLHRLGHCWRSGG